MQLEVIGINDSLWGTRPNARKVDFWDRSWDRSRDRPWDYRSWDWSRTNPGPGFGPGTGPGTGPGQDRFQDCSRSRDGVLPPQTAPDAFPDWHPCFRTLRQTGTSLSRSLPATGPGQLREGQFQGAPGPTRSDLGASRPKR